MRNSKETERLTDLATRVRRGGFSLSVLKPADVAALQDYALDIADVKLYDFLETYWAGQKRHEHSYALVDCARPMMCSCGEVRP